MYKGYREDWKHRVDVDYGTLCGLGQGNYSVDMGNLICCVIQTHLNFLGR